MGEDGVLAIGQMAGYKLREGTKEAGKPGRKPFLVTEHLQASLLNLHLGAAGATHLFFSLLWCSGG